MDPQRREGLSYYSGETREIFRRQASFEGRRTEYPTVLLPGVTVSCLIAGRDGDVV